MKPSRPVAQSAGGAPISGTTPEYSEADRPVLLDLLKRNGPLNVPRLSSLLGVQPTAVRQQLAVLKRQGLVEITVEKRPVGRPTHLYRLTSKAESLFPQGYGAMAVSLLRMLRDLDGDKKVDLLFRRRFRELAGTYRARLRGLSRDERLRELAKIREEEGYMAEAGPGPCLTEHHCPIAAVAREFPGICAYEHRLFEMILGIPLDRTDHIASGGKACTYRPGNVGPRR